MHASAGLTAAEYGDVQVSHDDGTTWQDVWQEGSQVRLHSKNNMVSVYGPGLFRVNKEATTPAVGVYLASDEGL